ncbi:glycoside hydrolase, partial [bacterium]
MISEVLLVHHSHTDIGYTHPQPVVFELHDRFIENALDLADATAGEREDARFRWTCEVTGITRAWWNRASNVERDRFLAAVGRGQFEVAALEWHLTPLADLRMLIRSLENVRFFRDLGIPVRSGMNTDVNGVPWGLVDVLLDHGIDGFSMSSNSHLGGPVTPRPGAFRWASPDGRELLVWNGFQYWHAANVLMRMPSSID